MNTLALDLAGKTGWAVSLGSKIKCGVVNLHVSHGSYWYRLWGWLSLMHQLYGIDAVIQERPIVYPGRPAGVRVAFGLAAACELWCEHKGISWDTVAPTTIKKFATGSGKANKPQMLESARERWPDLEIDDHNVADALWLLAYSKRGDDGNR